MVSLRYVNPLTWPILLFVLVICAGTLLLRLPWCAVDGSGIGWLNALFITTSATCVTGLCPIDIGTQLTREGQTVVLLLMQLGGLGITTYTSFVFLLWRNKVPFTDRSAVSQALCNRDIINIPRFIWTLLGIVLCIESAMAWMLWRLDPVGFHPYSAVFHAVSAFCNAGFSLRTTSLMDYYNNLGVNMVICGGIILGGLGFIVLRDVVTTLYARLCLAARTLHRWLHRLPQDEPCIELDTSPPHPLGAGSTPHHLDRYSWLVLRITLLLLALGTFMLWLMESCNVHIGLESQNAPLLTAFFQSVSARTAGFNTVSISTYTDTSLMVLMGLMFIGGSPGSCAGGIKTTTFAVLMGFLWAQMRGERQVILGHRAMGADTLNRALLLFFITCLTVALSVLGLSITENGFTSIGHSNDVPMITLLFEVMSAIATVGTSLDFTARLSDGGKCIIIANMFLGRVGFITLLAALQSLRRARPYTYPTTDISIG